MEGLSLFESVPIDEVLSRVYFRVERTESQSNRIPYTVYGIHKATVCGQHCLIFYPRSNNLQFRD